MKTFGLNTARAWRATTTIAAAMLTASGTAGAAFADPAQQITETDTGTFTTEGSVTCNGGPVYTLTDTFTITVHIVKTNSGQPGSSPTLHLRSITLSDSFTGTPLNDPTLPTVTGTSTGTATGNSSQTGAFNNTGNAFTTATYSNGTTVRAHSTFHVTLNPDATVVTSFNRCS